MVKKYYFNKTRHTQPFRKLEREVPPEQRTNYYIGIPDSRLGKFARSGEIRTGEHNAIWVTQDVSKAEAYLSGKFYVKARGSQLLGARGDHIVVLHPEPMEKNCSIETNPDISMGAPLYSELKFRPKEGNSIPFNSKFVKEIIAYDKDNYEKAKKQLKGTGIKINLMNEKRAEQFKKEEPYLKFSEDEEENNAIYKARELYSNGKEDEARDAYKKIVSKNPKCLQALIDLSKIEPGDKGGLEHALQALEVNPHDHRALHLLVSARRSGESDYISNIARDFGSQERLKEMSELQEKYDPSRREEMANILDLHNIKLNYFAQTAHDIVTYSKLVKNGLVEPEALSFEDLAPHTPIYLRTKDKELIEERIEGFRKKFGEKLYNTYFKKILSQINNDLYGTIEGQKGHPLYKIGKELENYSKNKEEATENIKRILGKEEVNVEGMHKLYNDVKKEWGIKSALTRLLIHKDVYGFGSEEWVKIKKNRRKRAIKTLDLLIKNKKQLEEIEKKEKAEEPVKEKEPEPVKEEPKKKKKKWKFWKK